MGTQNDVLLHSQAYYDLQWGYVFLLLTFGIFALGLLIYALWRFVDKGK
jgi:ABC-type polysaccharide/polyol phosphate export permease